MKINKNKIHIALSFDRNYIDPFYVLLTSIFKNNMDCFIVFHIIATGITDLERESMRCYVKNNDADIIFYEINESIISNLDIPKNSHLSVATYYRLLFPNMLHGLIEKVLYLDVDVLVVGKLAELYNQNVQLPAAVAIDRGMSDTHALGSYFNAGVILINIIEWEKQQVSERALDYLNEHNGKVKYQDQDALNIVLANNWQIIDNKFNFTFNDIPPYLPKKSSVELLKNITIIHYTGPDKPWVLSSRNRFRNVYFYYKKLSPILHHKKYVEQNKTIISYFKFFKVNFLEVASNFPFVISVFTKIKG